MKNTKIILIGSLILVVGFFAYKKLFTSSISKEDKIIAELNSLSSQATSFWQSKDKLNALNVSKRGLDLVDSYLTEAEDDSAFKNELERLKSIFKTVIFDLNK